MRNHKEPSKNRPARDEAGDLQLDARELEAMVRIARTISRYNDPGEILAAITQEMSSIINFDRCSVAFMSPDRKSLVLQHISKGSDDEKFGDGRPIPIDEETVIGWCVSNQRSILRGNIETDGRFDEVVKEEALKSDMIVPLMVRGDVLGTINVGCYTAEGLGEHDLALLEQCADLVSSAVDHALLLRSAQDMVERYQTLQRNASDMILLINKNTGRVVEANRKACEVLAGRESDGVNRSFFELYSAEDQFQARRDFINILSKKSTSFHDRRIVTRDGSYIYGDISASLIDLKHETYIQVMVHDISQRKMLEQQIIMQNNNLQQANKKLRDMDSIKTQFLQNISHELRTPLSIIIAYADSLRDESVCPEERAEFLNIIGENGQQLLQLINDLIDLSKLETSSASLSVSLSHIHDAIRSIWKDVQREAERKSINVDFQPGFEVPVAYFDNRRIVQVLNCLLHNALKFTDQGGTIDVSTLKRNEGVEIKVHDTGSGIAPEKVASVFDTFHQIDGTSTRQFGGLGIGLAMARHIVELHGGKIWVESVKKKGSTFSFTLPIDANAILEQDIADPHRLDQEVPLPEVPFVEPVLD